MSSVLRPASFSLRALTIWLSVNTLFFIYSVLRYTFSVYFQTVSILGVLTVFGAPLYRTHVNLISLTLKELLINNKSILFL